MARQTKVTPKEEGRPEAWRCYGRLLKLFREQKRLTQTELAEAVEYSYEHTASVEQGRRPATLDFTEAAERVLATSGALLALQEEVELAKLPKFFQDFAKFELEAVSRFEYEPQLVPGLLQSESYARAVLAGHCPPLDEETRKQHLEARLGRQRLLARVPLVQFSFILWEPALRNPVGGREVLGRQLRHLLKVMEQPNIEVQALPADYGMHPGLNGPMALLETSEHRQVGYLESQDVGLVITDPQKVSAFGLRYGKLRSLALSMEESARLIERVAGEL